MPRADPVSVGAAMVTRNDNIPHAHFSLRHTPFGRRGILLHGDTKICWKLGAGIQRYGRRSRQRGSAPSVEYEIPETNTLRPPTGVIAVDTAKTEPGEDLPSATMGKREDLEDQLLLKNALYPDCPGCKAAYLKHPDAKPPYKQLAIISALTLINVLPTSSLYPFLYFMVRDFHIAKSEKDIGFYAGYLGAVFMFGRFLTAIQWGIIADKYGRKPVMILGISSVLVFHTLFGASTTYWMAIMLRLLLGCFNGMLGTVKAYASEICSEKYQALSSSVVGTIWALGLIIGPAMGGYLAQPAIKYPSIFPPGSLFDRFPYLLPSVSVTVLAIPVLLISFILPETLHRHDHDTKAMQSDEKDDHLLATSPDQVADAALDESGLIVTPLPSSTSQLGQNDGEEAEDDGKQEEATVGLLGNSDYKEADSGFRETKKSESLWRNKGLIGAVVLYCIQSLNDTAFTEIFSLWCVSPGQHGGMDLTTTDVGQILAISGFTMLLFQILAFPALINSMGPVLVTRIASFLTIPLMAIMPFIPMLHGIELFAALSVASILKYIFSALIFTSSFLLVNNSVIHDQKCTHVMRSCFMFVFVMSTILTSSFILLNSSVTQKQRGAANGVATSAMSLFKAFGPAWAGMVFSWAQNRPESYILPGNQLVFFFLGAIAVLLTLSSFEPFMSRTLDRPIPED